MYVRHRGWIQSQYRRVPGRGLVVAVVLTVLAGGCSAFRVPEEPARPTPTEPVVSVDELRDHIEFLNGSDMAGRATGTQGYARAAAYVAARMREVRLQPAVENAYRIVYGASINHPVSSGFRMVGERDSLVFLPGIDYLPDGRSDSGSVRLSRLVFAGEPPGGGATMPGVRTTPDAAFAVLVDSERGPSLHNELTAWRDAGARLALVLSDLRPIPFPAPIRNLLILQVTPRSAGLLFGIPREQLHTYLDSRRGDVVRLARDLVVHATTDYQPQAGAINVLGYYSGKHPDLRGDLVIVCADLDAVGHVAGVRTLDVGNFGISTAAVLEAARNVGFVTRRWLVPDRSVMVAVWSGAQLGNEGLRYFLENPTWPLQKVTSVIYVGLEREREEEVRRLLDRYGLPLTVIPPAPEPLLPGKLLLQPDPTVQRMARSRDGTVDVVSPDMSTLVDSAVVRAARLARKTYIDALLEATDPATFFPVREDTPAPPAALRTE